MNNKIFKTTRELTPFILDMIKRGKSVNITVTGNSMFPLFADTRDTALIAESDKYKKLDIILYLRDNGDLILHRIVKKKNETYYLCGDNQITVEYPIYDKQIIGKVISFVRKGKNVRTSNLFYILYSYFWCLNLNLRKPLMKYALKARGLIK